MSKKTARTLALQRVATELLKANPSQDPGGRPSKVKNTTVLRRSEDLSKPPAPDPAEMTEDQLEIHRLAGRAELSKQRNSKSGDGVVRHGDKGRISLRAVADACVDAGLDPAAEIVRVLQTKKPALDRSGRPILGPDGLPVEVDEIDMDTRLRTLNELLQYTQPKLKAVEVKMSGTLEIPSEQLDQRLQALIAKAVK